MKLFYSVAYCLLFVFSIIYSFADEPQQLSLGYKLGEPLSPADVIKLPAENSLYKTYTVRIKKDSPVTDIVQNLLPPLSDPPVLEAKIDNDGILREVQLLFEFKMESPKQLDILEEKVEKRLSEIYGLDFSISYPSSLGFKFAQKEELAYSVSVAENMSKKGIGRLFISITYCRFLAPDKPFEYVLGDPFDTSLPQLKKEKEWYSLRKWSSPFVPDNYIFTVKNQKLQSVTIPFEVKTKAIAETLIREFKKAFCKNKKLECIAELSVSPDMVVFGGDDYFVTILYRPHPLANNEFYEYKWVCAIVYETPQNHLKKIQDAISKTRHETQDADPQSSADAPPRSPYKVPPSPPYTAPPDDPPLTTTATALLFTYSDYDQYKSPYWSRYSRYGSGTTQNWGTDTVQPNAYGLGTGMNQYGQPVRYQVIGQPNADTSLLQVQPNAYGLGVGMDQFGRAVRVVPAR